MNIPQVLLNKPAPGTQINFSHPLAKGLVGCWLFNEQSGNQAYDSSPYKNHGTLHGFNDPSSKDRSSLGLQLDGSTTYVDCGDASLKTSDEITIAVWMKPNSPASPTHQTFIHKSISDNYQLRFYSSTQKIRFLLKIDGVDKLVLGNTLLSAGVWYHITGTYDGSELNLFINGRADKTPTVATGDITTNAEPLTLGSFRGAAFYFNGTIDNVKIYNRALTASEIKYSYLEPYAMFQYCY